MVVYNENQREAVKEAAEQNSDRSDATAYITSYNVGRADKADHTSKSTGIDIDVELKADNEKVVDSFSVTLWWEGYESAWGAEA